MKLGLQMSFTKNVDYRITYPLPHPSVTVTISINKNHILSILMGKRLTPHNVHKSIYFFN